MSNTEREINTRERFFKKLMELVEGKKDNHYNVMTKDTYDSLLKEVEDAKSATQKTSAKYRRIKRFNVLALGDSKLATRREPVKYYLPMENVFNVIDSSHTGTQTGREDMIEQKAAGNSPIRTIRKEALANSEKQAARIMTRSDKKFSAIDVGIDVVISIPDVDRGKTDLPNLIEVVLEKTEHGLYRIGTKDEILDKLYCRYVHYHLFFNKI
ncbi:Hypothetical protein CINCED_3A009966 [Cinara cedri]|uniref:Uncharacterized protein n=1 Tax=Cinara cedri TaxID=506608 RepID=A0A5E4MEU3_9HEMI|nr:Hypothetical protein CINCED_3A009966 [Cinara cedri]